jgi:hypothetical protein
VKAVFDLLIKDGKNVALTWLSVVTQGHRAVLSTNVESGTVQLYALRFALYMALIGFLLNVPLVTTLRENFLGALSLAYTIGTYVEYMSGAVILHAGMRVFGGAAKLQASLAVFAFLTAYLPLVSIAFWPIQETLLGPSIGSGDDFPEVLRQIVERYGGFSGWAYFVLALSFIIATMIFLYMYWQVFLSFRGIHRLSTFRAIPAFALGVLAHLVFVTVFVTPLFTNLYHAVGSSPKPS